LEAGPAILIAAICSTLMRISLKHALGAVACWAIPLLAQGQTPVYPVVPAQQPTHLLMSWNDPAQAAPATAPMPQIQRLPPDRLPPPTRLPEHMALRTPAVVAQPASTSAPLMTPHSGDVAAELEARLHELERRIDELQQGASTSAIPISTLAPGDKPKGGDGDKKSLSDWVDMSSDKWTVKLGGHVQLDYIMWPYKDPAITSPLARNYFEFRRLRLVGEGTGYGVYDFRLQMTLEPETINETPNVTSPDVKDAYFTINETPWFGRVRIGNFFVPSSLEQVTNDTNNIFLERSIPTQGIFSFDREVGICSYNFSDDKNKAFIYGIFIDNITDSLKERIDDNQGYRLVTRATWLPYYDEPSNGRYMIYTGTSLVYTEDQDDTTRFRARPQIHEGPRLIDTGPILANDFTVGNVEGAIVMGRCTVQSEAFITNVDRNVGGDATLYGSYVHTSYFLTGENRIFDRTGQHGPQFGRNVPFSNVFWVPGAHGLGAWELKARWSYLDLGEANAGSYNDMTLGFNWYWSDRVRCQFDYIRPVTSPNTVFGATTSDIIGLRFDFNW
jgi:phosphate-selective porin OprO/OprP